jgi:hypothetical protein
MELTLSPVEIFIALFDKLSSEAITRILSEEKADDLDPGEILNCAVCGNRITASGFQTSIAGSHVHTCTNPAEITYRIGCFSGAWGCKMLGPVTREHSWFPGYGWRICNCSSCSEHLGWSFSNDTDRFYGLILGRLISAHDAS